MNISLTHSLGASDVTREPPTTRGTDWPIPDDQPYNPLDTSFPNDSTIVIMSDALVGGNTFVFLELHVARSPIDQSISVRVYHQRGAIGPTQDDRQPPPRRRQFVVAHMEHGEFLYEHVYNLALADGFIRQPPGALAFIENQEIGTRCIGGGGGCGGGGSNGTSLDPAVCSIVDTMFHEMYQHLNQSTSAEMSGAGDIRFARTGAIPRIGDIQKAEMLLREMELVVRSESASKLSTIEAHSACTKLSLEFFSLIPAVEQQPSQQQDHPQHHQHMILDSLVAIEEQRETVQLLRDLINVGEGIRGANALSDTQRKYKALHCTIEHVSRATDEYEQVARLVQTTAPAPAAAHLTTIVEIANVFRISRPMEQQFFRTKVGNERLLLHGSRPSNIVGILSRGLLMPRTVIRSVSRTDEGWLGSGLYFTDSISAALQYSPASVQGMRYVFCCSVALGRSKEYTSKATNLSRVPTGYDSTHGVKSTTDRASIFDQNEFVIYHPTQQRLRYLIQLYDHKVHTQHLLPSPISNFFPILHDFPNVHTASTATSSLGDQIPRGMKCNDDTGQIVEDTTSVESFVGEPLGLVSCVDDVAVPLRSSHVRAKVLDMVAEVIVMQVYHNESNVMIEAKYVFPLDEMSSVCGFEAFINGKHMIGVVKEKEQARREYRAAVEQGNGAYLLEQERPDIFTVRIGNLPPGAEALIKITHVTELAVDGPYMVFRLARAAISTAQCNEAFDLVTQNVTDTAEVIGGSEEEVTLQVTLDMPFVIKHVFSTSHDIRVKRTDTKASVEWQQDPRQSLDRDFELKILLEDPYRPRMLVEVDDTGHHAALLSFHPTFVGYDVSHATNDIVLLADCSASMRGDALQNLKRTLHLCINQIEAMWRSGIVTRFNLLSFGSMFQYLFPRSRLVDSTSLQAARQYIHVMTASLGGTDMAQALRAVLMRHSAILQATESSPINKNNNNNNNNIVLISDGNFTDMDEIHELVQRHRTHHSSRIFTFGVGPEANRHSLASMARFGGGACEFIECGTLATSRVTRQFKRIQQPGLCNIKLAWQVDDADKVIQAPATIESLYNGERKLVYGLVGNGICTHATLSAMLSSGRHVEFGVDTPQLLFKRGTRILHRLAARAAIRDWETGIFDNDLVLNDLAKKQRKEHIIATSIQHQIVCRFTSFLAIEDRRDGENDLTLVRSMPTIKELIVNETIDQLPYMSWELVARAREPLREDNHHSTQV